jgi:hypothetical protein
VTFPHRARDFGKLLRVVAEKHGLAVPLVEKDYWVALTLWGLLDSGLEIRFKGGTSLSKGFGLIGRFSEDLDLRIEPGAAEGLAPQPRNWTSGSQGQVRARIAYCESLLSAIRVPDARVRVQQIAKDGRAAAFEVRYPGLNLRSLEERGIRPFVQIEAGRARVTPYVRRDVSSFVHDHLRGIGAKEASAGLPLGVPCAHPLLTLLDKLDAISRRFERGDPAVGFVRHYEDAASIIRAEAKLPPLGMTIEALAEDMLGKGDIRKLPNADAAFLRPGPGRKPDVERAHAAMQGMYWGDRLPIAECCRVIRRWIHARAW